MTGSAPLDTEEAARSLNESDLLVTHLVLRPFVDAYRVVAEELVNLGPGRDIDEQELLTRCLRLGRQWSLQHRITEESVSGEMFSTALKMARHRGLLDAEGPTDEVADRRAALVTELVELQRSIGELARMRRDFAPGVDGRPLRPGVSPGNTRLVIWYDHNCSCAVTWLSMKRGDR